MTSPLSVLVVEDNADIRELIATALKLGGLRVWTASDGEAGLALLRRHHPAVVLLDVRLPGLSGREMCRLIRRDKRTVDTHVILVTGLHDEDERIAGFEAGADDYVVKPFSVRELVMRVQAAAARAGRKVPETDAPIVQGPVRIEESSHRVWVNGGEVSLTVTEYRLLSYLAAHPGKLCSRGELLQKVWDLPPHLNTRTVDTHVKRLRTKLGDAASGCVETVRGVGYRFLPDPEGQVSPEA